MRNLTLGDLSLGLANLLTDRKTHWEGTSAGQLYGPMLIEKHTTLKALPEALRGGKPLAEELGQVDDEHDGYGRAMDDYIGAMLQCPATSDDLRAAALRIRDAFIPNRSVLSDSYAEEAAAAKKNRAKLAERKGDLEMFPVPGGKTLHDWAIAFVDQGERLDLLLNERSLVGIGGAARRAAGRLRGETVGLLFQFRSALRAEMKHKNLPVELEEQVFSYLDELSARRPGKKKAAGPQE